MYKKPYSKTLYCQSVQKTNSVKMQSLKADALKQRKKLRLQFTPDHQNWTIEDWKNAAWSDESPFLHLHGWDLFRI